jgi:hypothetical protein
MGAALGALNVLVVDMPPGRRSLYHTAVIKQVRGQSCVWVVAATEQEQPGAP